jgi:hypothetical protein
MFPCYVKERDARIKSVGLNEKDEVRNKELFLGTVEDSGQPCSQIRIQEGERRMVWK